MEMPQKNSSVRGCNGQGLAVRIQFVTRGASRVVHPDKTITKVVSPCGFHPVLRGGYSVSVIVIAVSVRSGMSGTVRDGNQPVEIIVCVNCIMVDCV